MVRTIHTGQSPRTCVSGGDFHLGGHFNLLHIIGDYFPRVLRAPEVVAKIVAQCPNRDLSDNSELFLSRVKVAEGYKELLR